MNKELRVALNEICSSDNPAALVTIIKTKGSTPRKAGAKMLVTHEGQVIGTIGGGCGEAEVKREALNALTDLSARKYTVNMTQELAAEEGMVCGGIMEVLIDILPPGQNEEKSFFRTYIVSLESNEVPLLATVSNPVADTKRTFVGKFFITSSQREVSTIKDPLLLEKAKRCVLESHSENKPYHVKFGELELFLEPSETSLELIILGGGHIALPLASMAKTLGYHVTVIDDRPSFANPVRFYTADQVVCDDFVKAIEKLSITQNSFVIIVTRGHRHDKLCLQAVIGKPAAYIGMIGSKRRVKALMSELEEEGVSAEVVSKVYSPIGLDIGAETPEEIAVSILAEVIMIHRGC